MTLLDGLDSDALNLPMLSLLVDWIPQMYDKFGHDAGRIASSIIIAANGRLQPNSPFLMNPLWEQSARTWWGGFGIFSEIPVEVFKLIQEKVIETGA